MEALLGLSGLALVAAFSGVVAWAIVRGTSGAVALFGWLAWLLAPLLFLTVLFGLQVDRTLSAEQASYNYWFGLVLIGGVAMIPWAPGALIGGLIGWRGRVRAPRPAAPPPPAPPMPAAPPPPDPAESAFPDWRHPDNPRLSLPALREMAVEKARKGGIDPALLPAFEPPHGQDGEFVFEDKFDFVYVGLERGQPLFERAAAVADQLCYYVLRDRARALATLRIAGATAATYDARLQDEQFAILDAIDPRWGAQFRREQAAAPA